MGETVKQEWQAKVGLLIFLFFNFWWLIVHFSGQPPDSIPNQFFGATYGVLALWGAVWGLSTAKRWGGLKSIMGKALIAFSLGLFAQEFGQLAYSFYTYFLHVDVPYPSIGDVGYFGSIPLYIYGIVMLAHASGLKVSLKSFKNKIQAFIIPLVLLLFSYQAFLMGYTFDWSQPLRIFLDFAYPLGQSLYVAFALLTYLLSRKMLGGIMRNKILLVLFALVVQYVADYTFLLLATKGEAYPGSIVDYIYLIAYFLMAFSLFQFKTTYHSLQK